MTNSRIWPWVFAGLVAALGSVLVMTFPEAPPETPERVWVLFSGVPGILDARHAPGGEPVGVDVVTSFQSRDHPEEDRLQLGVAPSLTARFWLGECNRRWACYHPTGLEEDAAGRRWREFTRSGERGSFWWIRWSTCESR